MTAVSATLVDPFATASDIPKAKSSSAGVRFGTQLGNHRYKMPLLDGEQGPKSVPKGVQPWVPGGLMRVTNLSSAISDSRALGVWEMEQALVGLAKDPALYEELVMLVQRGDREGVNWQALRDFSDYRCALTGAPDERDLSLAGRAKMVAGANRARQAGINRHEAWEERARTGDLIGTPDIQNQLLALELLLAQHQLERVQGLVECVVRNTAVQCAGRFDDIVRGAPCEACGRALFMADLKNKSRRFWTMQEVRAQLAIYARSEWLLQTSPDGLQAWYAPGPVQHVCQCWGWVLVMPADGADPYLHRANLEKGWATALLARQVVEDRSEGKSVAAFAEAAVSA